LETPRERYRIPEGSSVDDWRVRVVGNKYPAFVSELPGVPGAAPHLQRVEAATGVHEVIIEGREHNRGYTDLDDGEVLDVMRAYRQRFAAAAADERIEHVVIFRNQGAMANASVEHPHSQLAGLAFVPPVLAERLERSRHYEEEQGGPLLCALVEGELAQGSRVVEATDRFATFVPFAPTYDYEMWVSPRFLPPRFDAVDDGTLAELGAALRQAISAMERALGGPDYNCILQCPPLIEGAEAALPWFFQIIPRRYLAAGFEMGVGVHILVTTPEEAAQRLRRPLF
jgi:UDPglucose--hexose-1-phosphate uridylyltransferase